MALHTFFLMSALDAAQLQEATAGMDNQLEPRKIEAGPYKNQFGAGGTYAVPTRVRDDEAFAEMRDAFAVMMEVGLETTEAWPAPEE